MTTSRMLAAVAATGLLAGSAAAIAQTGTAPAAGAAQATTAQPTTAQAGAAAAGTAATGGGVAQGATVYDPQGGTVGTIESVQGDYAVVATTKSKVRLPKTSFANGAKGPMIAITAAQLDQEAAKAAPAQGTAAAANAKPNVTNGAQIVDTQGGAVGTVAEVDAQFATVQLVTGNKVRLPLTAFGAGPNGTLRVANTAAQIGAAAAASGGSSSGG
jgi:preprotein translocase subunit YajC